MKLSVIIKGENIKMSFNFTFEATAGMCERSEQVALPRAEKLKKAKLSFYLILLLEIIPALKFEKY